MSQRLRQERAAAQQKGKSKWRWVFFAIGGIIGTGLMLGLIGLLLILHTTPPPIIHTDPAAAKRLLDELQEAQTAAAAGSARVIRADETEVNSTLEQYLRTVVGQSPQRDGSSVRDMKLTFSGDKMRVHVLLDVRGRDLTIELEGKVRTLNGYLDFQPLTGRIGALPVPKSSLGRAFQQVAAENQKLLLLPKELRDVHVEDSKIVVVYR